MSGIGTTVVTPSAIITPGLTPTQTPNQTTTPTATRIVTPTPTVTVKPTATSTTGSVAVSYGQYDWGSGATVNITIKNTGAKTYSMEQSEFLLYDNPT
jgi:hypothetical protein